MKKLLLLGLLSLAVAALLSVAIPLVSTSVYADTSAIASQPNKDVSTSVASQDWHQYLGGNLSEPINRITFNSRFNGWESNSSLQVRICKIPDGSSIQYCTGNVDTVLSSKTLFNNSNPMPVGERDVFVERTVTLDTPLALTSGTGYVLNVRCPGGSCDLRGSSDVNAYPDGSLGRKVTGGVAADDTVKDAYFVIGGEDEIEITFPQDSSEPNTNFSNWEVNYELLTQGSGKVRVGYGTDLNALSLSDEVDVANNVFSTAVPRENILTPGTWFAQAELLDDNENILETSPVISFTAIEPPDTSGMQVVAIQPSQDSGSAATHQYWDQYLGNNLSGVVDGITFNTKFNNWVSNSSLSVQICERYDGQSVFHCAAEKTLASKVIYSSTNQMPLSEQGVFVERTVVFDNPVTLNDGVEYLFVIRCNGNASNCSIKGSSDADSYGDGSLAMGVNGNFVGDSVVKDAFFILGSESDLTPVIIVPGIMGSRLNRVSDGEEVWPDAQTMFDSESDEHLDELALNISGKERAGKEMDPESIIDSEEIVIAGPISVERIAYGNLINNFIDQGYEEDVNLFLAPYDWRLDIHDEINRFGGNVSEAVASSPTGKINIVAHSMGGLLVREYLSNFSDTSFVDKLIIAGVPQLGAPKAFKAIMYGDNMGFVFPGRDILNPERIQTISQDMPGVYELLPSRRYVQVNGGYVHDFRSGGSDILDYDETEQLLEDNAKNSTILGIADGFHSPLDGKSFNAQNVYNIIGCERGETFGAFRIYDDKVEITPVDGDGTVPLTSAINLSSEYTNYFIPGSKHMGIIRDEEPLELINNILGGNPDIVPDGVETTNQECFNPEDQSRVVETLQVSTHSPVELHVYDMAGNHLGPNVDGDIDLQIPGGDYETIGHNNFAILPNGNYEIVVDATGAGEFDLEIETYADLVPESKVTYIDVPVESDASVATLDFSGATGDLTLNLDSDGDENTDEQIQPNAVLDSETAGDIIPPEIVFDMPSEVIVNSQVVIDFAVTDDLSGIEVVEADFDGTPVDTGDVVQISSIGDHILTVRAVDSAGNPRTEEFVFHAIYNFGGFMSPLIQDGSGIYKLGSTIPIKFQLVDANGGHISTASALLTMKKISSGIVGDEEVPLSTSAADTGNIFRYDYVANQYIYNLSTKTMSIGTWQLKIALGDTTSYEVEISLKK
ncbi:MAG: hypothetical protein A3I33_01325 [Candidatus Colwellbacteria bacterium RIFCSPLOWO2_02_FULL_45_11]|uniref:Uncharacterized protein n=1 Tax=Candidatus Colwellbacteria bacterium RIFCSPLOWO2_02_FULL_45_11 TaxID=1797692 RepID=A0A1G1Z8T1_9BACT|nr:MAG: hypothetical protein A3I33_01325 [Candidatus Colwellbacteria bacterium RIFCSPLOWO2_02_FULL_45_11]